MAPLSSKFEDDENFSRSLETAVSCAYVLTPEIVKRAGKYHNLIRYHTDLIFEKSFNGKNYFYDLEELRYDLYWMFRDIRIDAHTKLVYEHTISELLYILENDL